MVRYVLCDYTTKWESFYKKLLIGGQRGLPGIPLFFRHIKTHTSFCRVQHHVFSEHHETVEKAKLVNFFIFLLMLSFSILFTILLRVLVFSPHFLSFFISVQGENNKGCNNIVANLAEYESLRDALPLCLAAMFRWCKCNYFYGVHVMAFL